MRQVKRDFGDYKGLAVWKVPFKILGRMIMGLLYFVLGVGLPVAIGIFWDDIKYFGTYDFFGIQLSTTTIAWIVLGIFVPIGAYGTVYTFKMLVEDLRGKNFSLPTHTKIVAISVIVFVAAAGIYYTPGWYLYLGIDPEWGPYTSYTSDGNILISWDTREPTTTQIEYGLNPENLDQTATGGEYFWESDGGSKHHAVKVEGLDSNQKYYYRIPGFDSNTYYFHTPPDSSSGEEVCFTILGDTQGNLNVQKANINQMVTSIGIDRLNFTVIVGDSVNDDDDLHEWDMLFDKDSYGEILPYVPWQAGSGNHECGTEREYDFYEPRQNFEKHFQQPFMETRTEEVGAFDVGYYYSMTYSNVHMVVLDPFEMVGGHMSNTQMTWLENDLAAHPDDWKFLCFHLSMYSSSDHGSYPGLAEQLEPIMDEYDVHALFYGHDHIFEYYDVNATDPDHTLAFMCAGGGGSLKQVTNPEKMGDRVWPNTEEYINDWGNNVLEIPQWTDDDRFETQYGWEWQKYAERTHHYMKVSVDGNEATFSAYRTFDNSLIKTISYNK